MPRSQQTCVIAVGTALGEDAMILRRFQGREALSELFSYQLEMDSENHRVDYAQVLGTNVTVRLEMPGGGTRYWNGFMSRFRQAGVSPEGLAIYHAEMVPWLWFLTRTADCRIYQKKTVPQILEDVFARFGFTGYRLELNQTYPEREYCVQYRETAFNFVSRLMEEEGIFYYFAHENGRHEMVIVDSRARLRAWPGYEEIPFLGPGRSAAPGEVLSAWNAEYTLVPGAYVQKDYNFRTPAANLEAAASVERPHPQSAYEVYDYPGLHEDYDAGVRYARTRIEELQWQHAVYRAVTNARGVAPGCLLKVRGHPRTDASTEFLVVSAEYRVWPGVRAEQHHEDEEYVCEFQAIRADEPFRPLRRARKPVIEGPQTAVVVGPAGEEVYPDEYGRVIVQFHWDRQGQADENSSCWIRVAQLWAGRNWGAMFLPRIGQEVIVEFLEGNPDRPIITGRVYHAQNMPPYPLPDEKTKSTIKSNSTKGGGGFNEIRFEDKKGSEQLFVHAERNQDVRVKNDSLEWVGHDRHLVVKHDQIEKVEGSKHSTVSGDRLSRTGGDRADTIAGNRLTRIRESDHLTVDQDQSTHVKGEVGFKGDKNVSQEAGAKISVKAGTDIHEKAGMSYALEAGQEVHIKGGMKVVIEAGLQLSLKMGGNFIDIGPAGISIQGVLVKINSGGAAGAGSGSSPEAPAAPEEPDPPRLPQDADTARAGAVESAAATAPPSEAAQALDRAAVDGSAFCEECARAAEEQAAEPPPAITRVAFLDGADDRELSADGEQWVNLPREAARVDAAHGVGNLDRLSSRPRFKVTFSRPGAHAFTVRMEAHEGNAQYSAGEKGRNPNFTWQEQTRTYTTEADGTRIVDGDFFLTCAGGDRFRLIAADTNNNPEVHSGWLTVRRLVYVVPIRMRGMTGAASLGTLRSEMGRHGIVMAELPAVEIDRMPNIGPAEETSFQSACRTAFGSSEGHARAPYAVAIAFTEHLAVKNPNQTMELTGVAVGPGAAPVSVPIRARGLRSGDGMAARALWRDLVDGESWFVSCTFTPDGGGTETAIPEARCTPATASGACYEVRVDVTGLAAGTGTLRLTVNVVDRMRGGLSFGGGNLICICTKGWWQTCSGDSQNLTAIHEFGHKIGMVPDGTGQLPDAVPTRYEGCGHVGSHCHAGLPVQASYLGATGARCAMFGETSGPSSFCDDCAVAATKMDLSGGWPVS